MKETKKHFFLLFCGTLRSNCCLLKCAHWCMGVLMWARADRCGFFKIRLTVRLFILHLKGFVVFESEATCCIKFEGMFFFLDKIKIILKRLWYLVPWIWVAGEHVGEADTLCVTLTVGFTDEMTARQSCLWWKLLRSIPVKNLIGFSSLVTRDSWA